MSVIYFFWLQCIKQEFTLFVSSKKSNSLYFFPANWLQKLLENSPRETAVDIVLDISENSHGNVYSEVLSEVVAYEHGVY